ncbi:MAG: hypothetical protein KC496_18070 [Anaerolineae bacterium]|nr:hypothetical protein [Anaerolineae bacterium]
MNPKDLTMKLTEDASRLLEAIEHASKQPVSRAQIADKIGKRTLSAGDLAYLDMLAINGVIAKEEHKARTPTGFQYKYRFISRERIEE